MSRSNKTVLRKNARRTWCWRRWVGADQQEIWVTRLEAAGCPTWTLTQPPDRVRVLLAVYAAERAGADSLRHRFGGQVRSLRDDEWISSAPAPATRIGRRLEIVHEKASKEAGMPRLHIPHGMAFGSGDHGTTGLLLRALTGRKDWAGTAVLDLGTGSGVLALAVRLFGGRKIVGIDFDAEAVRTARQNEELNFSTPLVRWRRGDVRRLRAAARYDLVLANLFSGILCEAAPQIGGSVAPGGELWLSGILRSQGKSVADAYRRRGFRLIRVVSRGKWLMLQLRAFRVLR